VHNQLFYIYYLLKRVNDMAAAEYESMFVSSESQTVK
jgi:hypothetical protein